MAILWSQQQKLAAAVGALTDWEAKAQSVGVHVAQINIELLSDDSTKPSSTVIFDWNADAQEYEMRTP